MTVSEVGSALYEVSLPELSYEAAQEEAVKALEAAATELGPTEVKVDWETYLQLL